MADIILFGAGWEGQVRHLPEDTESFRGYPRTVLSNCGTSERSEIEFKEISFVTIRFKSRNGRYYLLGTFEYNPMIEQVERAIWQYGPSYVE